PKQAIRLGRMLEELDIGWLEEPVSVHDLVGQAEVRNALDLTIASGETEWTRFGIRNTIEARAADVLMPDLQRIGGLTEMRRVAALAEAYSLPISTHIFTEHSLCIAGSAANCISVEHMPWYAPLFREEMKIVDGDIIIPVRPGTGFTFDEAAVTRFAIDH
ncbi:MAG: mandelate racemase/muconate lactonizing enzyme family protein, partial [Mesorhizobium sp.]